MGVDARHPALVEIQQTYETICADLEPYLAKEEQVLFPMIGQRAEATSATLEFYCE